MNPTHNINESALRIYRIYPKKGEKYIKHKQQRKRFKRCCYYLNSLLIGLRSNAPGEALETLLDFCALLSHHPTAFILTDCMVRINHDFSELLHSYFTPEAKEIS